MDIQEMLSVSAPKIGAVKNYRESKDERMRETDRDREKRRREEGKGEKEGRERERK